jgi:hypothetical protein
LAKGHRPAPIQFGTVPRGNRLPPWRHSSAEPMSWLPSPVLLRTRADTGGTVVISAAN